MADDLPRYAPDHDPQLGALCAPDTCAYCEAIRALMEDWPPLTDEQVAKVVQLLQPHPRQRPE